MNIAISFHLNVFSFSCFLTVLTCLSIAFITLIFGKRTFLHRLWILFNLSIALWGFGAFFLSYVNTLSSAILFTKIAIIGVIFTAVLFFHVTSILTGFYSNKSIAIVYLQGILASIADITGLFTKKMQFIFDSFYYPLSYGPFYLLLYLTWIPIIFYGHYKLIKAYRISKGLRRTQLLYFIIGTIIGFLGGIGNFLPGFGIKIYPYSNFSGPIYAIIGTYAILRYRLMDIRPFIKEATVFGIAFGIVAIVFSQFATWISQVVIGHTNIFLIRMLVLFTIGIAAFFIGRTFFKKISAKKTIYQAALQRAVEDISKVKSLQRLLRISIVTVYNNIPVEQASIIYLEPREKEYIVAYSKGKKKLPLDKRIKPKSPLIQWFKTLRNTIVEMKLAKEEDTEVLVFEELNLWLRSDKLRQQRDLWRTLIKLRMQLKKLNTYLCVPGFCKGELTGIMLLGNKLSGDLFTQRDYDLLSQLAAQVAVAVDNLLITRHDQDLSFDIFKLTLEALEAKDGYTRFHSELSAKICKMLAEKVRNRADYRRVEDLVVNAERVGYVHDIGKLKLKDEILQKPEGLTEEEWTEVKKHPEYGAKIISVVRAISQDIVDAILYHQEKWDGSGYPKGLKRRQIPQLARIAKLADSFEAMISDRSYRKSRTIPEAVKEIERCKRKDFDPNLVEAFIELYKEGEIEKLFRTSKV